MVLAIQARKSFQNVDSRSVRERPLSERAFVRRLQLVSRWCEAKGRAAANFLFHDAASILLTDIRRLFRATGRLFFRLVNPALDAFDRVYTRFSRLYQPALESALNHKGIVILCAAGLLGVAGYIAMHLGAELIPSLAQGEFTFEVRLPEGKALRQTDLVMSTIEREVAAYPEVRAVFSSVGGSNKNQFAHESKEENVAQLYVVLKNKRDKAAEARTIERIRNRLQQHPEVTFTFSRPTLFSVKTPVEVEIYAYDLDAQRRAADLIAGRMQGIRGLSDIRTSTELGNPEIQVRFDRERLARLGLDETQVSNAIRSKIRGDVATRYREDDKQIEILVRADESQRNTVESVQSLLLNVPPQGGAQPQVPQPAASPSTTAANGEPVRPADPPPAPPPAATPQQPQRGVPIRLASIADVLVDRGPSEVRRIRSQRAAVVSANLSGRDLTTVSSEIRAELQRLRGVLPGDMTIELGGQNEELSTSYNSLLFALVLAVFLVYLVMASEFESFLHPLIILFSVPFGLVGVVLALTLTRTTISVMVLLGVIILIGIVVNNAIVLIDYTNRLRTEGYSKREALKLAGEVRMRPILMTMLTSVLGLVPMAVGWGDGAEIRSPMAITVIGGLAFSTVLTLIFIPVIYEALDRKRYAGDVAVPTAAPGEAGFLKDVPGAASAD